MPEIKNILIVGNGTMGRGLAELFLTNGCRVTMHNPNSESLVAAGVKVRAALERKGISVGPRLTLLPTISTLVGIDVVLECAPESYPIKQTIWNVFGRMAPASTLLASGTSSLSITRLGQYSHHGEQFIGLHFFNPPTKMRLVEVVPGLNTSKETVARAKQFCEQFARQPIVVRDSPGFAVNRILLLAINQAVALVESNVASAEEIDQCMELGCNHPMGPLKLADYIGLDVCVSIFNAIAAESGERHYEPRPLLVRMVHAGYLGKKTGRGFLRYDQPATSSAPTWTYNENLYCNAD